MRMNNIILEATLHDCNINISLEVDLENLIKMLNVEIYFLGIFSEMQKMLTVKSLFANRSSS